MKPKPETIKAKMYQVDSITEKAKYSNKNKTKQKCVPKQQQPQYI